MFSKSKILEKCHRPSKEQKKEITGAQSIQA